MNRFLGRREEHVAGLASPNEPTEEHEMVDEGVLHVMDDDEKMDEDEEEEQEEEEHQKARAMASPDHPSRRAVEDHNTTHIPFRSWCDHCLRENGGAHTGGDTVKEKERTTER